MGINFSSSNNFIQKASKFKLNLYQRVQKFKDKYHNQLIKIDHKLKQKVIISSVHQLVQMVENKQVTSYQLVLIFAERTSAIGIKNNYVFDQMFQDALQIAQQCDRIRKLNPNKTNWKGEPFDTNKSFPPFYGIPASYKENIRIKNRITHVGFIVPHQKNYPPEQNGLFAEMTMRMGFIPFVRSTTPMSCKTNETNNFLFGYAKNPWNQERSCGGSSGGQGGLIASYCSPIGFGTDIGGSLRIPSQWNGLMTLKPGNRYSRMGNCFYGKITGGTPIKSDFGPIAKSVKDIQLFMKFMCDQKNYETVSKAVIDPYLNLKPWKEEISKKKQKLKLGYIINLQTLKCSLSHARVVNEAVQILRAQGHQVKEIKMPKFQQLYFGMMQMYFANGGMEILNQMSPDEPILPQFKLLNLSAKLPNFLKAFAVWALQNKQPRLVKMLGNSKTLSVGDTFKTIYDMQNDLTNVVYHYFIDNDIDAIVMPGFAHPSPKLGTINKLQYCIAYTMGWNVVNYPVGSIPMSLVEQNEQFYEDQINDSVSRSLGQVMKQSKGLPVGIQIASLPYKQQIIVHLMSQIQKKVQFRQNNLCTILNRQV